MAATDRGVHSWAFSPPWEKPWRSFKSDTVFSFCFSCFLPSQLLPFCVIPRVPSGKAGEEMGTCWRLWWSQGGRPRASQGGLGCSLWWPLWPQDTAGCVAGRFLEGLCSDLVLSKERQCVEAEPPWGCIHFHC